jgi:hypothetical protein
MPSSHSRSGLASERFASIYLAVSSLVMVALIGVVVLLVVQENDLGVANRNNAVSACQQANTSRVTDQEIDRDILALPAISSPQFITPASAARQRIAVAVIQGKIRSAYALHNCVAQYSTK